MRANSLSNDKILEVTKFKAFADDKLNVPKMIISVFGKLENIEGKGKKCWLPAFSPFPTTFSKGFFLGVVQGRYCVL